MRGLARLALALATATAVAHPASATREYILPTLFDVTDVAAGDVLNIRAAPDAGAAVIGGLAPDAVAIEVVAHDASGRWGRVNAGESGGWVAMRHLAYRTDVWEAGRLPASLHCLGTEPFWSVRAEGAGLVFATPEAPDALLELRAVLDAGMFRDPRRAVIAQDAERRASIVIAPASCSDGMSDRAFGLSAHLILESHGAASLLSGCCSIAP